MGEFEGFPKQTLTFIRGLSKNNNKQWFDSHRSDYERYYTEPAKAFVIDAGRALKKISPGVQAEPKVNGSLFRINRDIRFSNDKTPYKDHLDLWFWEGPDRKSSVSGFYVRLTAKYLGVGVGAHGFGKETLEAYRRAVAHPTKGPALVKAVEKVEKAGYQVSGMHYKRPPRGFEASGEVAPFLLHNALWVGHEDKLGDYLHSSKLIAHCSEHWKKLAPLHRWLVDSL